MPRTVIVTSSVSVFMKIRLACLEFFKPTESWTDRINYVDRWVPRRVAIATEGV
jgi:hypothetical protein